MKRLISVLICLALISNIGFAEVKQESSKGFYYMIGIASILVCCAAKSSAQSQLLEANDYFRKASDDNFNFGVYWQMYFRSMREQDRLTALEYGASAIYNQDQAQQKYKQYAESESWSNIFLTISVISLFTGISMSIKDSKRVVLIASYDKMSINYKF